jgi:hypothetical protein
MNAATSTAARSSPRTCPEPKPWDDPILRSFLLGRTDPDLKLFLIALETLGSQRPWGPNSYFADVSNDALADALGAWAEDENGAAAWKPASDSKIVRLWKSAEREDFITRVFDCKGDHIAGRIGFVWHRRPTPRPFVPREELDRAAAELRAAVADRKAGPRTVPFRPAGRPDPYRGGVSRDTPPPHVYRGARAG